MENGRTSAGNNSLHSETYDTCNVPAFELAAAYKILDSITDSDPSVSSLTGSCCNEISRILRCLLAQRRDNKSSLEDEVLSNDSSLYKCERCGVISCTLHPVADAIKPTWINRRDTEILTAKRDLRVVSDDARGANRGQSAIPNPSPEESNRAQQLRNVLFDKMDGRRVERKYEPDGAEASPVRERDNSVPTKRHGPNRTDDIRDAEADATAVRMKNKSHFDDNLTVTRDWMPPDVGTSRRETTMCQRDGDSVRNDRSRDESLRGCADKEEITRKISYERKSQIDYPTRIWYRETARRKTQRSQQTFGRHDDAIFTITDTMKYLARGPFATTAKEEDELLLSKLQDRHCARLLNTRKRQSSILYGSRDDYPQHSSGFWLFDQSGRLPDECRCRATTPVSRDDGESAPPPPPPPPPPPAANVSTRRSNSTGEKKTREMTGNWSNCLEKDSLEDCARLRSRGESDAATFVSSSSVDNLMYRWLESVDTGHGTSDMDDEPLPRGRTLVSSRPSLDIARHVKAEMARNTCFDGAKRSTLRSDDSSIVARLSPETRRKIRHLIRRLTLTDSDKDSSAPRREGRSTTGATLNDERLLHSRSVDARFVRSNNPIINVCASDCIPTRLSDSSADNKNHSCAGPACSADTCSQDVNKSTDLVGIDPRDFITGDRITAACAGESTTKASRAADNGPTKRISRQIIYKDASSRNHVVDKNEEGRRMTEILPMYRQILKNSGNMEWDSFRVLVESLHPEQKEIWRAVCETINEEAKRDGVATDGSNVSSLEVFIEISPVDPEEATKRSEVTACTREIVFEMDMTLKDIEGLVGRQSHPTGERLEDAAAACNDDERQRNSNRKPTGCSLGDSSHA